MEDFVDVSFCEIWAAQKVRQNVGQILDCLKERL
jgi:hypothetical protein